MHGPPLAHSSICPVSSTTTWADLIGGLQSTKWPLASTSAPPSRESHRAASWDLCWTPVKPLPSVKLQISSKAETACDCILFNCFNSYCKEAQCRRPHSQWWILKKESCFWALRNKERRSQPLSRVGSGENSCSSAWNKGSRSHFSRQATCRRQQRSTFIEAHVQNKSEWLQSWKPNWSTLMIT